MSLIDRTNEDIPLSLHDPMESADWSGLPGWNGYGVPTGTDTSGVTDTKLHPAQLSVDADSDSSFTPSYWVNIGWTDNDHDSDTIRLTYEEASLLHDRLGLILGRPPTTAAGQNDVDALVKVYQKEWEAHQVSPILPKDASIREQLDDQFRFRLARAILLEGYRQEGAL